MAKGPSPNAAKAADILIKQIKSGKGGKIVLGKILKEVGYSEEIQNNPQRVTKQQIFIEKMEDAGLTDEKVMRVHEDLLKAEKIEKFYFDSFVPKKNTEGEENTEELFRGAKLTVVQERKASASLLQRKLKIGHFKAAKLMDMLQERGIIGEDHTVLIEEGALDAEDFTPVDPNSGEGQPAGLTDKEIKKTIEQVPGCRVLFINRMRSRWGTIEVIYAMPDNLTRKAAAELSYRVKGQFAPDKLAILGQITHTHEYNLPPERKKKLDEILLDNK